MPIPPNPLLKLEFTKLAASSKEKLLDDWRRELSEIEKRAATDPSSFIRASMRRSAEALRARIEQLSDLQE